MGKNQKQQEAAESVNFMDAGWTDIATRADKGDPHAAKEILEDFAAAVEECSDRAWSGPIPRQYAVFLARAFRQITNDQVACDVALGLRWGSRPTISDEDKRQRNYEWCMGILSLKASGRYDTLDEVKEAAKRKFKVSRSAIDKAWKTDQRIAAEMEHRRMQGKKAL